jgi:DNA-binding CsgD family transcriptional regulator
MGIMDKLTPREREVVSLLLQGRQQREIATALCITPRTVKAHVQAAREKAGARTSAELAAKVAREVE